MIQDTSSIQTEDSLNIKWILYYIHALLAITSHIKHYHFKAFFFYNLLNIISEY